MYPELKENRPHGTDNYPYTQYLLNIIPDETALMFIPVQTICFALTAGKQKRI